jgi:hypothetical protein
VQFKSFETGISWKSSSLLSFFGDYLSGGCVIVDMVFAMSMSLLLLSLLLLLWTLTDRGDVRIKPFIVYFW